MKREKQRINPVYGYTSEFGERLQTIVKVIGTQVDSAKIAEVSTEQMRSWLSGKAKMPLFAAGKLCDAAGVTLDWLYSGKELDERLDNTEPEKPSIAELGERLRRSREVCDAAIQVAGWEPPRILQEMLRTMIFTYNMKFEDVVLILDAARPDR